MVRGSSVALFIFPPSFSALMRILDRPAPSHDRHKTCAPVFRPANFNVLIVGEKPLLKPRPEMDTTRPSVTLRQSCPTIMDK